MNGTRKAALTCRRSTTIFCATLFLIGPLACRGSRESRSPRWASDGLAVLVAPAVPVAIAGDSLSFTPASRIANDSIFLAVTLRNIAQRPIHLAWGACSASLLLFREAPTTEGPVYDWLRRPDPPTVPPIERACPLYLVTHTLQPSHTTTPRDFVVREDIRAMLGDSLRAPAYRIVVRIVSAGSAGKDGWLVPAGTLKLTP